MITVSVTINRPVKVVWDYFTATDNWSKWYGGGVRAVTPTWQQGAMVMWAGGGNSPITKFVSDKEICIAGSWMDDTYSFAPKGNSMTIVKIIESDPKGGASFNDGGRAQKATLEKYLQTFKQCVEEETSAVLSQEKKWWQFWK